MCWYFPRPFCLLLACLANLFLAPFAFALGWIRIYVIPCLLTTLHMMLSKFCCELLKCGKVFPKYRDMWFPANDASIGYNLFGRGPKPCLDFFCCCCQDRVCLPQPLFGSYDSLGLELRTSWSRRDGQGAGRAQLFEGKIEAADVQQGGLGNCWLLAAIGAIAEAHPEIIRSLFLTNFVEPCGIYRIRLYDVRYERWTTVVIDDRIPMTDDGMHPRFSRPNGPELWVLLLEKAFAKLVGRLRVPRGGSCYISITKLHGQPRRAHGRPEVLPKYVERPVLRCHPRDFVAWVCHGRAAAKHAGADSAQKTWSRRWRLQDCVAATSLTWPSESRDGATASVPHRWAAPSPRRSRG